jgi:hypothetical protein
LAAFDIGRGRVLRLVGGEVIKGGKGGWLGFDDGDDTTGGEVAGDEVDDIMMAVVMVGDCSKICYRQRMTIIHSAEHHGSQITRSAAR